MTYETQELLKGSCTEHFAYKCCGLALSDYNKDHQFCPAIL